MLVRATSYFTLITASALYVPQAVQGQYLGSIMSVGAESEQDGSSALGSLAISAAGSSATVSLQFNLNANGLVAVALTATAVRGSEFGHAGSEAKLFLDPSLLPPWFEGTKSASGSAGGAFGFHDLGNGAVEGFTNSFLNLSGHVELRGGACANFGCGPSSEVKIGGNFNWGAEEEPAATSPEQRETLVASTTDLDDLRNPCSEETAVSCPMPISGTYLSPVLNSFGRTQPIFVGPQAGAGGSGEASLHAQVDVTAYRYTVEHNLFTHFILPAAMPGGDSELQVEVGGNIVPYTPGTLLDLTQYVSGGVSEFFLSGIDVAEGLQMDEVSPFVSGLQFAMNGAADITIAPADISVFNDYNADGMVDGADYVMLQKLGADDAYIPWLRDFGSTYGGGGGSASDSVATPEPTSMALIAVGVAIALVFNSRGKADDESIPGHVTLPRGLYSGRNRQTDWVYDELYSSGRDAIE